MTVRLVIAGPNLTIDRTARIDHVRAGEVLRTHAVAVTPGGKGVNVARAAALLDAQATLVGFLPGRTGGVVAAMLGDHGVDLDGVAVPGEIRSASILHEPDGRTTVINEPGPPIGEADWRRHADLVATRLEHADVLVCSGSAPPGTPADAYAKLARLAAAAGLPAIVDATGPLLAAAVDGGVAVVCPNLAEARTLLGPETGEQVETDPDQGRDEAAQAARALVDRGAAAAIVTAGALGAAVAHASTVTWVAAPTVEVVNGIGAGDCLVAATAVAMGDGADVEQAAMVGVATGSASVETPLGGTFVPDRVTQLRATLRATTV